MIISVSPSFPQVKILNLLCLIIYREEGTEGEREGEGGRGRERKGEGESECSESERHRREGERESRAETKAGPRTKLGGAARYPLCQI